MTLCNVNVAARRRRNDENSLKEALAQPSGKLCICRHFRLELLLFPPPSLSTSTDSTGLAQLRPLLISARSKVAVLMVFEDCLLIDLIG